MSAATPTYKQQRERKQNITDNVKRKKHAGKLG